MKNWRKRLFLVLFLVSFAVMSPVIVWSMADKKTANAKAETETEPFIKVIVKRAMTESQTESQVSAQAESQVSAQAESQVPAQAESQVLAQAESQVPAQAESQVPAQTEVLEAAQPQPEAEKEAEVRGTGSARETAAEAPTEPALRGFTEVGMEYFADALLIGDSRTVGLSEYGGLTGADFFASIGMSVFNVNEETVSVPGTGKVLLADLLAAKQYGKIYVMLGINEIGYPFEQITEQYEKLVKQIQSAQPEAILYVCANLHVAASRSDADPVYNNANLNRLNQAIAAWADQKQVFYIDVNECFDDASGNLDAQYTSDASHVLGKYYKVWAEWLCTKGIQK